VNSLRAKTFKKEEFDDESLFRFFHLKHAVTLTSWRSILFFPRRVSQFIEDHVRMKWSVIDFLPNNNSFLVIIYWFSEIAGRELFGPPISTDQIIKWSNEIAWTFIYQVQSISLNRHE
jgi:hypothetical protein